jgi:hypothetical protein
MGGGIICDGEIHSLMNSSGIFDKPAPVLLHELSAELRKSKFSP